MLTHYPSAKRPDRPSSCLISVPAVLLDAVPRAARLVVRVRGQCAGMCCVVGVLSPRTDTGVVTNPEIIWILFFVGETAFSGGGRGRGESSIARRAHG